MNKVVHFEIAANNIERAKRFYKDTFGWEIEQYGAMQYWGVCTTEIDKKTHKPKEKGAINGGLFKRNEKDDPGCKHPMIVIDVPNMPAHLQKVMKAGGKIVLPPKSVGGMGMFARVEDTEGNIIGLWQELKK